MMLSPTEGWAKVKLTAENIKDLQEELEKHEQLSDCQRDGNCCACDLIELLEEILADA